MASILNVEGIHLKQGRHFQLENIHFHVEKGKVISILGPNGSGKSTILRVISRLLKRDQGFIQLNGVELDTLSDKEISKQIAMLSQTQQNTVDITVRELVTYGRQPYRQWYRPLSGKDKEVIEWAIKVTHLETFQNRPILSLSGGERQRAWIAMAIAQMPKVLLLDEPTTYLDIKHQLEIMQLVKTLNKLYGMTIIMVLHDMNQAYQYSDEVLVMKKGQVYGFGKPEIVFTQEMFEQVFEIEVTIFNDLENRVFNPIFKEEKE